MFLQKNTIFSFPFTKLAYFPTKRVFLANEKEFLSTPCIHAEEEKEASRDHNNNAVNCSTELYIPRLVVLEVNERCHCEKWDSEER